MLTADSSLVGILTHPLQIVGSVTAILSAIFPLGCTGGLQRRVDFATRCPRHCLERLDKLSKRIEDDPTDTFAFSERAELFVSIGDFERAAHDLEEFRRDVPPCHYDGEKLMGIHLGVLDGTTAVVGVLVGSPAERAGILPGDIFMKVDGHPVAGLPHYEALQFIYSQDRASSSLVMRRKGKVDYKTEVTREPCSRGPIEFIRPK